MDAAAIADRNGSDRPNKGRFTKGHPLHPKKGEAAKKARVKLRSLKTLDSLDGRTLASRHAYAVKGRLEADLGGGDHLTEGQRRLIQRAAVLDAIIESDETNWLSGQTVDINLFLAAINAQRRVLTTLGLDRRSRDVTPPGSGLDLDAIEAEVDDAA
jgi:hypothetical protein